MKGLIPAAGEGKRLRPYTKAIPKELLLIGSKPIIEHVIEGFKLADITDITIVINPEKQAILKYLAELLHFF